MASPRIILTGGSKGMGLAVLRILLERYNARVATLSRSYPDELKSVVEKYGSERVIVVQGDVGKSEDNVKVVKTAVDAFGGLDSLILNAATLDPVGRLADISQDALIPYMQINVFSTIYIIQAALPHLRKQGGRVVVTSSGASTGAYGAWGLYSMSKAAQNSLVRTLALEEKANGVSVFAVRPGVVDTDVRYLNDLNREFADWQMQKLIRETGGSAMDPDVHANFIDTHAKGKLLAPELPGAAIAGLAVSGSAEMSGEYIQWSDERIAEYQA